MAEYGLRVMGQKGGGIKKPYYQEVTSHWLEIPDGIVFHTSSLNLAKAQKWVTEKTPIPPVVRGECDIFWDVYIHPFDNPDTPCGSVPPSDNPDLDPHRVLELFEFYYERVLDEELALKLVCLAVVFGGSDFFRVSCGFRSST